MGKFKRLGAILAAVILVLIAVTLDGGTALAGIEPSPFKTNILDIELSIDNIFEDGNSKGNVTFTGQGKFVEEDPVVVGGFDTIDFELESLSVTGIVGGKPVRYEAGSGLGHPASLGEVVEQAAGAGCSPTACFVTLEVFFEITCGTPFGDESCCDIGPFCGSLENCPGGGEIWTGTTLVMPAVGVYNAANSSACLNGLTERTTGENLETTVAPLSVGGIAERLGTSAGPDSSLDSSSGSGYSYAALGGALAAAAVAVAVGGWYARRRWLT